MNRTLFALMLLFATQLPVLAQRIPPPGLMPIFPPRIELSDADAKPMQIEAFTVSARLRGLHAVVDTTIVFHNPNARQLEGDLVFPLPDGAAVCGYALDINGVMVDGVVVKKEQARVAFETETRRRIDPGLVEHIKGNLYRTRIYPLPGKGTRTIRLSYTSPLATDPAGDAAFLLPLPRETIGKRVVTIEVAAENMPAPELGGLGDRRFVQSEHFWRVGSVETNVTPAEDIWVALPKLPATFATVERAGDGTVWFALSTLAPPPADKLLSIPSALHILWDASGSRSAADLQNEYELISRLQAGIFRLTVFRDTPEAVREFKHAADVVEALKQTPFDGGSDFAALSAALPQAGEPMILFTDGLDTLSGMPVDFRGVKPVAVVSQTTADREALRQACGGALIDLQTTDIPAALRELSMPSPRIAGLKGRGIAQVQGVGRPARGRILLLGQLTAPEATVQVEYAGGELSEPFVLRAEGAREGRTLATAWAAARVQQLSPRAAQFEDELLELGKTYGLVSPATSLLVLESLDQWVRHGIEPPASLPDMRNQWNLAMKNRGQSATDSRTRHLEQLAALWKQRVDWWKTDHSKVKLPPTSKDREDEAFDISDEELGFFDRDGEVRRSPGTVSTKSTPPAPPRAVASAEVFEPGPVRAAAFDSVSIVSPMIIRNRRSGMSEGESSHQPDSSIQIKAWNPDRPYLKAIRKADPEKRYEAYLAERKDWAQSPGFFLDCADVFLEQKEPLLGLRILSNLAELKIEEAALLRVLAWRLRQAGELDRAIVILRRVARLRAEEPQSFRDLALALADRGKTARNKADLEASMDQFLRVVLSPWGRHGGSLAIVALEELNALVAWIKRANWKGADMPIIPEYDEKLRDNLDTDLRIVMAWDADATDIDLHIFEPGGDEASFRNNRTARGGLVSRDITDGYGPEEYLIRAAPRGPYTVKAHYYGSRQQTVVGAATVTATVFTDWGRATEKRQLMTLRLDKPNEMVEIGRVVFGISGDFAQLRVGMSHQEVIEVVGRPSHRGGTLWRYAMDARTMTVAFDAKDELVRVIEILPGGIENIIVQ